MIDCNEVSTPLDSQIKLYQDTNEELINKPYRSLIGSIMYLQLFVRGQIGFAATFLSQFNEKPTQKHWAAAKRLLQYLEATATNGIRFVKTEKALHGYVDADHLNSPDDSKSFTGYIFVLAGGPVMWSSKKQSAATRSSTAAEYRALNSAACAGVGLNNGLEEILGSTQSLVLHCDNQGAIFMANNPVVMQQFVVNKGCNVSSFNLLFFFLLQESLNYLP